MPNRGRVRIALAAAVVAMVAMSGGSACAQPNPYHTVENWAKLPEGRTWGEVIGVAVDRDGNIWTAERCGTWTCAGSNLAPILKFDLSGRLLKSFGEGMFVFPHGFYLDQDDNVWVTDAQGAFLAGPRSAPYRIAASQEKDGRRQVNEGKGHQVFKFSPEGKVLLVLGKAGIAGDGPDTFNSPTAVVVASNGDIFVADGHGGDTNARIVKFSKDGQFLKAWGKKGSAPGEFDTLHSLAMDSTGRLFVGDRDNNRIQIFDQDGKFLEEWKQFGRPSGMFISANDTLYVTDSQSGAKLNPGFTQGIRIGSTKDGVVKAFIPALGPEKKPTSVTEGVAADAMGNVYGGETATRNLRKYIRN
jgi:sugar lactone lactonase YvrE